MFASNKAYPTLRKNAGRKNLGFIASSDWDSQALNEALYNDAFYYDELTEGRFEDSTELLNRYRINQAGHSKSRHHKGGMA